MPFGILIFLTGTLLIINLWGVVDAKFSTDAAAREGARSIVESSGIGRDPTGVEATATQIAVDTMRDHGRDGDVGVDISADGALVRCQRVHVTVRTEVPAIRIPFIGRIGPPFSITSTHSEIVDPTRSGVGGEATCIE